MTARGTRVYNAEFAVSRICLVLARSRQGRAVTNLVRREAKAVLGDAPLDVVGDSAELRDRLRTDVVDVVVVDGRLGWTAVPEVVATAKDIAPGVPVLLLADRPPIRAVVRAVKAGVADCVPLRPGALRAALRECLDRPCEGDLGGVPGHAWRNGFELAPVGLCVWGPDGRFLAVNPHALAMMGCERSDLQARGPAGIAVDPDDFARIHDEVLASDTAVSREFEAIRRDGTRCWIRLTARAVRDGAGRPRFVVARCEDVSEDRQQRAALRAALAEREVLLREVHHRVKNNLQIVSSLLNLRFQGASDPAARDLLRESQLRIKAIALVHQRLYSSASLIRIDLGDYVPSLVANVRDAYAPLHPNVAVALDVAPVSVCMEHGIRLGLMLTELVANAFKHAWVGRRAGCVRIAIRPLDEHRLEVHVEDDGVGLPQDLAERSANTLGLGLVRNLVDQVWGSLSVESQPNGGTRFHLVIPRERPADPTE